MAKITVKKLDIMSVAKLEAVVGAIVGFIAGLLTSIASGFVAAISSMTGAAPVAGFAAFGFTAVIIMPIVYAVMGFIGGAVGAYIYNLVAGWIGGIKFET